MWIVCYCVQAGRVSKFILGSTHFYMEFFRSWSNSCVVASSASRGPRRSSITSILSREPCRSGLTGRPAEMEFNYTWRTMILMLLQILSTAMLISLSSQVQHFQFKIGGTPQSLEWQNCWSKVLTSTFVNSKYVSTDHPWVNVHFHVFTS